MLNILETIIKRMSDNVKLYHYNIILSIKLCRKTQHEISFAIRAMIMKFQCSINLDDAEYYMNNKKKKNADDEKTCAMKQ